ncbi:serine O-acetyltransferase EpsC [Symbioplanes lichenis]|uniref:serine O-acetyltransferase EpsC n=1 Tax=Symbioplanes lichenis TaxID=1629072 RepID=UPI002739505A|nr:serine O-acetyltransferase EpsC [Actinoplanes lichenis]
MMFRHIEQLLAAPRALTGAVRDGLGRMREDIQVVREKDPAVNSSTEVLLYPHIHALWLHRVAHLTYRHGHRTSARAIALFGRFVSGGIDIHPGARIGRRFFIDHGAGVVIGEHVEIGEDVMLYHLVTLGSVGWWHDIARGPDVKRHPTIGDSVVLGTAATVLGAVTIGAGSRVGAHAVVLTTLEPGSRVPTGHVVRDQPPADPAETPQQPVNGRHPHLPASPPSLIKIARSKDNG